MRRLLLSLIIPFVFPVSLVFAESTSYYTISPSSFLFTASPGQTVENTLQLYNDNTTPIELSMEISSVEVANSSGQVAKVDTSHNSLEKWLILGQRSVRVPAKKSIFLPVTVTIPQDTAPGVYSGTVIAVQNKGFYRIEKGSAITVQVGQREDTMLSIRRIQPRIAAFPGQKSFITIEVENQGLYQAELNGKVKIVSFTGKNVDQVSFGNTLVMPGKTISLDIPISQLLPGYYNSSVEVNYGISNKKIRAQTGIISFSFLIPLAVGVLVLCSLLSVHTLHKRYGKKSGS